MALRFILLPLLVLAFIFSAQCTPFKNVTQHTGYITVNGSYENGAHMFYWFFESQSNPSTDPLILWLTGGPGCSGLLAMFYENGPFTLTDDLELKENPYGWNSKANLLYVDNPVGTGFSYADSIFDYVRNEEEVAEDLYVFLENFFRLYPKYASLKFHIFGESYAGHYIPATAYRIFKGNQESKTKINLESMAIGNGWVNPAAQYPAYLEYAYNNGLINDAEYEADKVALKVCEGLLKTGAWPLALEECQAYSIGILFEMGVHLGYYPNPYNWKIACKSPPLCYNFDNAAKYLNQESVKKQISANPKITWKSCATIPHTMLLGDWVTNLAKKIPLLLNNGIRTLVYSGVDDFICNWEGGKDWTYQLPWSGQKEFNNKNFTTWTPDNKVGGEFKTVKHLTLLKVKDAGHMVPMDQPSNSLSMVNHWINSIPFDANPTNPTNPQQPQQPQQPQH